MNSSETIFKSCLKCGVVKENYNFVIGRNLCKGCRNEKIRVDYANLKIDITELKCNDCNIIKSIDEFYKGKKICISCSNIKRRNKYATDEVYRKRVTMETLKCRKGKPINPSEQIRKKLRSNICRYLTTKNKRTMDYLGCTREEYLKWLLTNNTKFTLENHGKEWHIDHVIPLSKFDIYDENEKMIAFNWRNTTPLSAKENLKKNNKIIPQQIEEHYKKLIEYHQENKLDLPQVFIDLFAKHLVDGNPLKLALPLAIGNKCEDLS